MRISPQHGYLDTVFYIDTSDVDFDLNKLAISVITGEVYIVNLNYLTRVVSIRLKDSTKGVKTVTLTDGTTYDSVNVVLELPHNPENREGHTIQDSKRPDWPYRTY